MPQPPTVVTAFYPIRSKFPSEQYIRWISQFWPATEHPLIFFVPPALEPLFKEILGPRKGQTLIWPLPFEELAAIQRLCPGLWIANWMQDPEKGIHTPELYSIWFEKKEFVRRAIERNPFGSETFVWCDAGICRYPSWVAQLKKGFPQDALIPRGKMLVLQINPFTPADAPGALEGDRIGGGILASDAAGWSAWYKAYDTMFMQMYLDDHFVGKDQTIMASCILENPSLALGIPPLERIGLTPVQKWFSLLFYLAGAHVL